MAGAVQRSQRRHRVGGRAEEDEAHGVGALEAGGRGRCAVRRGAVAAARRSRCAQLAQRLAADVGLEPVEEQHAVEVVDLVLDHAGEQVVAFEHDLVAVEVEAAHRDALGPHDLEAEARAPTGSPRRRPTRPWRSTISGLMTTPGTVALVRS